MKAFHRFWLVALASLMSGASALAQPPAPAADQVPPLIAQSQQEQKDGHLDEAVAAATKAVAATPQSVAAHMQLGIVLDLTGRYTDARTHFKTALDMSKTPETASRAARAMAVSYAFEDNCSGAASMESPLVERSLTSGAYIDAGEVANELARICLESGDMNAAETWYRKGHDAALQDPALKDDGRDLWAFRWEHAQARLAARRQNPAAAASHIAAAKAILDKGRIANQAPFFPYLTGYVAFYSGDYRKAIADLAAANQNDPFILSLTAQALEKSGDAAKAMEYYRKIVAITTHNAPNAFARPLAKQKIRK
jgi:tetratricopeptide (TPR) repeat protein